MTLFKRAWLNVVRKKVKTGILFLIVFLLSIGVSGAISASQAILNAELNLRRSLPAVSTIIQDEALIFEHLEIYGELEEIYGEEFRWITAEIIESIGQLPQVSFFDYSVINHQFFSSGLSMSRSLDPYTMLNIPNEVLLQLLEPMQWMPKEDFENFRLKGVFRPEIIDIETGVLELLEGRVFRADEMGNEPTYVAIVSEVFAIENELSINETFTLHYLIFDEAGLVTFDYPVMLEIVGIFSPTGEMNPDTDMLDIQNHINFNQLIYVPMAVSKAPILTLIESTTDLTSEQEEILSHFHYEDILFSLYDPLELEIFTEAASQMIPMYWIMDDLTNAFAHMSGSMEIVRNLATSIFFGISIASLIVLGILITLFLYDRQHEMGVYLALGESKVKIVVQMLVEIGLTALLAIVIALFIGNFVASQISVEMIRTELIRQSEENTQLRWRGGAFNNLDNMGHGIEMTHEEMLATYSVSLDYPTVIIFIGASILMITFSTILPTMYLVRLKPKDILMKASTG